jgi:3-hydroxybutyryl-CoA dehydratase
VDFAVRFKAPVRIGDTVKATCTVREVLAERRRAIFDCACTVGDVVVLEGEATVMPPVRKA